MPAPQRRVTRQLLAPVALTCLLPIAVFGCRKPKDTADTGAAVATGAAGAAAGPEAAPPDEGPLPKLRTGELSPEQHKAVDATIGHSFSAKAGPKAKEVAQYVDFNVEVGNAPSEPPRVALQGMPDAYAVGFNEATHTTVTVRRRGAEPLPAEIKGTVYVARGWGAKRRWHATPFTAKTAGAADDADLPARFENLFPFAAEGVRFRGSRWGQHPWGAFAASRMQARRGDVKPDEVALAVDGPRGRDSDLTRLMETTSAAISLQEALQHERGLRGRRGDDAREVEMSTLKGPPLKAHPFEAMRKALPDPDAGHTEGLAKLAPADFWYLRFTDVRLLLRTLDEADAWLTPVVQIMQSNSEHRDLTRRYQGQLALRRSDLARALGNTVIEEIALVGSDPYLREGSDITILFAAKNREILQAELGRQLESWKTEVPGVEQSSFMVRTHEVQVWRDPAGVVRRHQVWVEDTLIVSNSKAAITRVLDTIDDQQPSLDDQPELAFMLARDPNQPDAFAFLSDAFIASVIGPQQKIAQARRQLALADLLAPGYGALLHGWLEGRAPTSNDELLAGGYLMPADLKHGDGTPISFSPGTPARSSWGTVESLTPLIDLPPITKISERERLAYEAFSRGYQNNWTTFIDPVALSLDVTEEGKTTKASVGVRVLPLISNSEYDDILQIVADQRVDVPDVKDGVQIVWAAGKDTRLRREFNQMARSFTGEGKVTLDWLGDWVAIGALDRKALLEVAWYELEEVQLPEPEEKLKGENREVEIATRIGQLPVFAMADTGNPAGVAATLTGLKGLANSAAPGMLAWGEDHQHREVPVVRVAASATSSDPKVKEFADAIALYYANAGGVLIFALREDVLHTLMDRALDGRLPKGADESVKQGPQFVMSAASGEGRALWTALAWSLQGEANKAQGMPRQAAEILLRGDPATTQDPKAFEALARAYFGAVPTTASGRSDWKLEGAGVRDPIHGPAWAPTFVDLPVEGSPIAELMDRLTGLRGEVGFEEEAASGDPPGRSLVTKFELTMGPAKD